MSDITTRLDRMRDVRRIFEDNGFGSIELLESWEGDDLGELSEFLSPEEFQTLLDELERQDDRQP